MSDAAWTICNEDSPSLRGDRETIALKNGSLRKDEEPSASGADSKDHKIESSLEGKLVNGKRTMDTMFVCVLEMKTQKRQACIC